MRLSDSAGSEIWPEPNPIATGGQGEIYRISTGPHYLKGHVLKLYSSREKAARAAARIEHLVANPPDNLWVPDPSRGGRVALLAWPITCLKDVSGSFVGFAMPEVTKAITLREIVSLGPRLTRYHPKWSRFSINSPECYQRRLGLAQNIAAALHQIHLTDRYVVVDLKPENLLVRHIGFICLVDVDSAQVSHRGTLLFPGAAATPEYMPQEGHALIAAGGDPLRVQQSKEWDLFSYAVIVYELLLGIHPFLGPCRHPAGGNDLTAPEEKILLGLFANGRGKHYFTNLAPPHGEYSKLAPSIRSLFERCFDHGHRNPRGRPTADEWCRVIHSELKANPSAAGPALKLAYHKPGKGGKLPPRFRPAAGRTTVRPTQPLPTPASPGSAATAPPPPHTALPAPPSVRAQQGIPFARPAIAVAGMFLLWLLVNQQSSAPSGGVGPTPSSNPVAVAPPPPVVPTPGPSATQGESQPLVDSAAGSGPAQQASLDCTRRICVYESPTATSPAFDVDAGEAFTSFSPAMMGWYSVTFATGRFGLIRSIDFARLTTFPSTPATLPTDVVP
jgi:serine/threonine protein kinase